MSATATTSATPAPQRAPRKADRGARDWDIMAARTFRKHCLAALVAGSLVAMPLAVPAQALPPAPDQPGLRLLGSATLPAGLMVDDTRVGGLSGLDYDPATRQWLLVSDDRSRHAPARVYTATLDLDAQGLHGVTFTGMRVLRQADGTPYPDPWRYLWAGGDVPDWEAVRWDPLAPGFWLAGEGDRALGLPPGIVRMSPAGQLQAQLPTLPGFGVHRLRIQGPRRNLAFEGLAFAPDGQSLWVGMEAPLAQDGPVPTPDEGGWARFTRIDREGGMLAQVAYPVDPIPARPAHGRHADNGVSEILALDATRLLVLERAAVQPADGPMRNFLRLYLADLSTGSDVRGQERLRPGAFTPVTKQLVLDLTTLGTRLDNLEGMAWGPRLPNGNATLVMVSDDNFNPAQVTLFLAFEVTARAAPKEKDQ